ncbi:MAG: Xaa-Pro peptidase family protein [Sphaerochaetaceae bacterium]|nr:Xaa-Pro peptidase family protein [Sphaerochaetaceae bacterium]MDC7248078.1 Xaa-Pro peptidase family protein [Sphaerochaetaceae bacterium]
MKHIPFGEKEYARRVDLVKERMDHRGIEVLLVLDPSHMNYLTGFDGWSFYVHQGLVISLKDEYPSWFGRAQDSNAARMTTYLPEDHIYGYKDEYVQSRYIHTMEFVAGMIKGKGKTLAIEMDGYWCNPKMYSVLHRELPSMNIVDSENLVGWVKTIKSEQEIAYIREAGKITVRAMDIALENIREGVAEREVAALVSAQQIRGTDTYGGDSPAIFPIIPSAERTSSAHLTYSPDRSYQKGDVVLLELGSARYHYHAPLSRTVFIGDPPKDLQHVSSVVVNGLQKTLEEIGPGMTAQEVESVWRSQLAGTGVEKPSRVGYSFGLAFVPDWGEHTVSLRPGDMTVLKEGMTIHFMPGIWLDTYGFECSEPFVVTSSGCEKLIEYPQRLFTL